MPFVEAVASPSNPPAQKLKTRLFRSWRVIGLMFLIGDVAELHVGELPQTEVFHAEDGAGELVLM